MPRPTISKNHVAPLEQVDGCLAIYVALPERALQILVRLLWAWDLDSLSGSRIVPLHHGYRKL